MKRIALILILIAGLPALAHRAAAQDAATEERLTKLRLELETLQEANVNLQKTVSALDAEVKRLRDEISNTGKYASLDEINRLAEALKEIDKKREADKHLFVEKFEEIRKIVASAPPPAAKSKPTPKVNDTEPKTVATGDAAGGNNVDKGVYHTVEKGQYLSEIIKEYNKDLEAKGKTGRITLAQVMAANTGLDPTRMKIGQKIFIPIPDK
jgi:LysM repeat protein